MKKIFTLLAMLISLGLTSEIIATNLQVSSSATGFTSIDGKGVATFVVKSPVAQSCDLSFLMMPGEYEDGSFTSVTLKVNGVTLPNPITFNTYGWQPANTIGNVVTLNEGDNTIQFISGREDVPMVNDIKIWDENNSYNLIPNMSISQTSTTINTEMQNSTSVPDTIIGSMINPIKYGFLKTEPYRYTTIIPLSFDAHTTLTLYAPSANDPKFGTDVSLVEYNAYIFNEDFSYSKSVSTNNKTFYWQDIIPSGNYYILIERANANSPSGYVTIRVNSMLYKGCYASGVFADFSVSRGQYFSDYYYNMFTTNVLSRDRSIKPNPILWLKKKVGDNQYIIIAANNDNKTPSDHNWGLNARIRYLFTDSMIQVSPDYSVLLSSYDPRSTEGVEYCDLYYSGLRNGTTLFKNTKIEDAIRSDNLEFGRDDAYNCFAWSAGSNTTQLNPPDNNSGNILWFDSLYNNQIVYSKQGYFQRDLNSVRYTQIDANESNAVIALWGKYNENGLLEIRHASIKDNPYDSIPHGYSWESKNFVDERFFHPFNGLADTDSFSYYGNIVALYRPIVEQSQTSSRIISEKNETQNNSFENIDISELDLEIIANFILDIPLTQINKFESQYKKFEDYALKQHYASSIWDLKNSDQYKNLLLCMQEINNGEYMAFDKFAKGSIFAILLIEDYAKSTPTTKDVWNKIFYNKEIMHIKRTQRSKVNLFIKNMLLIKNAYSVTNNAKSEVNELFNVVVSGNTVSIDIDIEEISTYSIKVVDFSNNSFQTVVPETRVQVGKYEHAINIPNGNYIIVYCLNGDINTKKIIVK